MQVSLSSIGRFHHFDLARQLLRLGHQVSMFTSLPRGHVDEDLRRIAKTRLLFRIPSALASRLGLAGRTNWLDEALQKDLGSWLARSLDPEWTDVLHGLDGPGPKAGRIVKANGKIWICDRGSSHILTQKAIMEEEHKYWQLPPPPFCADGIERCVAEYEEAHAVTVPSQFVRRSFLERGFDAERVYLCPYGVDLSEFRPAQKADGVFRAIFVGNVCVRKGIGHLLRAVEPLVRKHQCELWLVGGIDSSARKLLHQFSGVFEYKGLCPREDLWRLYAQASVMVLPSVEEGLALVQAQAMACGVPVIATTNTGAEDLFTDGIEGFIVPIRSPEAIREKVEWMIANPMLRDQMSAAAIERVKALGGWQQYGEKVDSVYRDLAIRHHIQMRETDPGSMSVSGSPTPAEG
jgi:glycosyltransferase involved in cell wall biosynthesis